jgi:hypothetical protein
MYLILRAGWRDHSGIFICRSGDIALDDLTIHLIEWKGDCVPVADWLRKQFATGLFLPSLRFSCFLGCVAKYCLLDSSHPRQMPYKQGILVSKIEVTME